MSFYLLAPCITKSPEVDNVLVHEAAFSLSVIVSAACGLPATIITSLIIESPRQPKCGSQTKVKLEDLEENLVLNRTSRQQLDTRLLSQKNFISKTIPIEGEISSLMPCQVYLFVVKLANKGGATDWSDMLCFETKYPGENYH
ncbi:unnamed protein product [Protopolystoma xenopodis]|uniref:Fibronectin type-III domain-containing protein n=1 Tax=Protopolystoma xenopodis TaxID=117903 RepID=A0A448WGV8_9PLAT|nr:unnamed protein product [Protopolystoma xenopodis]